jgi:hypothetical protein
VGHLASRERWGSLARPGLGRRLPARLRGHHRVLVRGDRRLRRSVVSRAVDGQRPLGDPGPHLPGRPSDPVAGTCLEAAPERARPREADLGSVVSNLT